MADYLLMLLEDEAAHAAETPRAMAELIDRRAEFTEDLRRAGQLAVGARLRPSAEGKRVRAVGTGRVVEPGPFAEEGKALGAFYWVKTGSAEEAAALAGRCPGLPSDEIDVRPIAKGKTQPDADGKPGKVFAFAVLGNAPTEEAWTNVMDRIDAEGTSRRAGEELLCGVRLEAPTRGKRVATRGERRAMFDGPFLESKEVVGGVFLTRFSSLDGAVEWARAQRFLAHGGVEIRELWRS